MGNTVHADSLGRPYSDMPIQMMVHDLDENNDRTGSYSFKPVHMDEVWEKVLNWLTPNFDTAVVTEISERGFTIRHDAKDHQFRINPDSEFALHRYPTTFDKIIPHIVGMISTWPNNASVEAVSWAEIYRDTLMARLNEMAEN